MITTQNLFQHLTIIVIDSDEVLYYVDGDFMSRNNIEGHITLHPRAFPWSCARSYGTQYRSYGNPRTSGNGDTFRPLMVTEEAMGLDDGQYYKSWVE
jgi:homogentisate 1,2-dioxygenase